MSNRNVLITLTDPMADYPRYSVRRRAPVLLILLLYFPFFIYAQPPSTFTASYEARFGAFKASAERSLLGGDDGNYKMETVLELKLLGQTLSAIHESSTLVADDVDGKVRPKDYSFVQSGFGKRNRSIFFDWEAEKAFATVGDREIEIPLVSTTYDNLSAYLEVRRQLLEGKKEIVFSGIDKEEVEEFRYQVTGEEIIETILGRFRAVKLERIRDPGSDRITVMWLAPDWDYLLVKMIQEEPDSRTIRLDLKQASVNEQAVESLVEDADATAD